MRYWILGVLLLLLGCSVSYDPHLSSDPAYVLRVSGEDVGNYAQHLEASLEFTKNRWARGDTYLVLARITNNTKYYKKTCDEFQFHESATVEEEAILLETMASLNCNDKASFYLIQAIEFLDTLEVGWRSLLLQQIIDGSFEEQSTFETEDPTSILDLDSGDNITLGTTTIEIMPDDTVVTQSERVFRDWLGVQLHQDPFKGEFLTTFSERMTYNATDLTEVGWHEGGRIKDLEDNIGNRAISVAGTIAAEKDGKWYAVDEDGIFRFGIPLDKIYYPTTRFLTPRLAMIVDTHGVNMLVEQSIRRFANVVISDCDFPGKVKAAKHLSDSGIKVVCFPDRFMHLALGHDLDVVGSPVWKFTEGKAVYGNAPLVITRGEKIIVSTTGPRDVYALQYYDAAYNYFALVADEFPLDIIPVELYNFGEAELLYKKARFEEANYVATRIFDQQDYAQAKMWLDEDENHNVIMFHSTMYPNGIRLMKEFPGQITFGDTNIKVN
jgi:hypothetical protein